MTSQYIFFTTLKLHKDNQIHTRMFVIASMEKDKTGILLYKPAIIFVR